MLRSEWLKNDDYLLVRSFFLLPPLHKTNRSPLFLDCSSSDEKRAIYSAATRCFIKVEHDDEKKRMDFATRRKRCCPLYLYNNKNKNKEANQRKLKNALIPSIRAPVKTKPINKRFEIFSIDASSPILSWSKVTSI